MTEEQKAYYREYMRQYRLTHNDAERERQREYRRKNAEAIKLRQKEYRENNKERCRAFQKAWREHQKDKPQTHVQDPEPVAVPEVKGTALVVIVEQGRKQVCRYECKTKERAENIVQRWDATKYSFRFINLSE